MSKFNKLKNAVGFTMVELLFVLVIIGILAAVAAPVFLGNSNKARASEAVATMGLIRQTLREERINSNIFQEVDKGKLSKAIKDGGLGIDIGVTQYFSEDSFKVTSTVDDAGNARDIEHKLSVAGSPGTVVDFLIEVTGKDSVICTDNVNSDCAVKAKDVEDFKLQMDNAGRIAISYGDKDDNDAEIWKAY